MTPSIEKKEIFFNKRIINTKHNAIDIPFNKKEIHSIGEDGLNNLFLILFTILNTQKMLTKSTILISYTTDL
jgi:hypothetical protein